MPELEQYAAVNIKKANLKKKCLKTNNCPCHLIKQVIDTCVLPSWLSGMVSYQTTYTQTKRAKERKMLNV